VLRAAARWLRRRARTAAAIQLDLVDGAAWSVRAGRGGALVRCQAGSVWLTREGDPQDRVLGPGQPFRSAGPGRLALLALGPARVAVELR
jgi:ferric-dicitrate binding protein FerR (iron transport regulator)